MNQYMDPHDLVGKGMPTQWNDLECFNDVKYSFGLPDLAKEIEWGVEAILQKNIFPDLDGDFSTRSNGRSYRRT